MFASFVFALLVKSIPCVEVNTKYETWLAKTYRLHEGVHLLLLLLWIGEGGGADSSDASHSHRPAEVELFFLAAPAIVVGHEMIYHSFSRLQCILLNN